MPVKNITPDGGAGGGGMPGSAVKAGRLESTGEGAIGREAIGSSGSGDGCGEPKSCSLLNPSTAWDVCESGAGVF